VETRALVDILGEVKNLFSLLGDEQSFPSLKNAMGWPCGANG